MSSEAHTNDVTLIYDLVRYCMIMLARGHLALNGKKTIMNSERAIQ